MIANFVFGKRLATAAVGVAHQEADRDDESCQPPRAAAVRVRNVVAAFDFEMNTRPWIFELRLRLGETLVRQEVERAVVETADVRSRAQLCTAQAPP